MRTLALVLAGLLVLIQYPLWLGKGGWLRVWELDRQVVAQRTINAGLRERNSALEGEVNDLKQGLLAIEERARYELGMIRPDEIFVQLGEPGTIAPQGIPRQPDPVRRAAAPARAPDGSRRGGAEPGQTELARRSGQEPRLPEGIQRTGSGAAAGEGASAGSGGSKVSTGATRSGAAAVSGATPSPEPAAR
jgi:cell division protein FtsB